jgi:NAD(P)-dependent dehydrogenase (short-subunit alcohol dehydrogenase family)
MPRPLAEQVVVITGASSGIGRETARLFAQRGAAVVLAARDEAALREVAAEVDALGGRSLAVPTDVTDMAQMQRLADEAVRQFGRIDIWVNNAGVAVYGAVERTPIEELRRVIEVDLLGTMQGAKAALPHLRLSGGTLINVSSIAGERALPLLSAYCAAKHGVIGFSDALRMELIDEDAHVAVTTILPSSIDTPFFKHARSRLGVLPRPMPPVYEPAAVAEAIVWAAEHPTRQIVVGGGGKAIALMQRLSPALLDWLMTRGRVAEKAQESNKPDDGLDNLYAPMPESNAVRGEFAGLVLPGNGYTRTFEFHPARQRLAVAALLLALAALACRVGRG